MKGLKLFKKISAIVTVIAMFSSFGAAAVEADPAPTIEIATVAVDIVSEGVYEVSVPYTVTGTLGEYGITMLTYTGDPLVAEDREETPDADDRTYYDDTKTIVGINQYEDAEASGTITFNVEMDAGSTGLVMLGGDGIDAPAMALFAAQWKAETVEASGTVSLTGIEPNADNAVVLANIKTALDEALEDETSGVTLTYGRAADEVTEVLASTEGVTSTIAGNATDGFTATFTVPAVAKDTAGVGVHTNGIPLTTTTPLAIDVEFAPWAADTVKLADGSNAMTFSIAALGVGAFDDYDTENPTLTDAEAKIADYIEAQIKANGIKVSNSENGMSKTLNAADLASVTVEAATGDNYVEDNIMADGAQVLSFTVVFDGVMPEGIASIADMTITATITKFVANWGVETATFQYPTGDKLTVTYDWPDGRDKVEKATAALVGKTVLLEGTEDGQEQIYPIIADVANVAEFTDITEEDAVATITIPEETYGVAVVPEGGIDVEIVIKYAENDGTFTASGATLVKGDGNTDVTLADFDVTVDKNTAAKIAEAMVAEGLKVKATLTRGTYVESVLIPVTADMIDVTAPTLGDSETTGDYTATITVETNVDIDVAQDVVGNLTAKIEIPGIAGTVTVETGTYADLDGDGYITGNDVNEAIKYVNKQSAQGANPDYEPYVFINGTTQEPIPEIYGDVDNDTYITGNDVNEIIRYVNKQSAQGANPDYEPYVFPVLQPQE